MLKTEIFYIFQLPILSHFNHQGKISFILFACLALHLSVNPQARTSAPLLHAQTSPPDVQPHHTERHSPRGQTAKKSHDFLTIPHFQPKQDVDKHISVAHHMPKNVQHTNIRINQECQCVITPPKEH